MHLRATPSLSVPALSKDGHRLKEECLSASCWLTLLQRGSARSLITLQDQGSRIRDHPVKQLPCNTNQALPPHDCGRQDSFPELEPVTQARPGNRFLKQHGPIHVAVGLPFARESRAKGKGREGGHQ